MSGSQSLSENFASAAASDTTRNAARRAAISPGASPPDASPSTIAPSRYAAPAESTVPDATPSASARLRALGLKSG